MRFSQRIGKKPSTKEIQLESMDDDLRNGLWNVIKIYYLDLIRKGRYKAHSPFRSFIIHVWHNYYILPFDEINGHDHENEKFIRDRFFNGDWLEVYDFIQFLIKTKSGDKIGDDDFITALNNILIREFSGYRIINDLIAPISSQLETEEVNKAITNTINFSSLGGANIHLNNALGLISDRKKPDYRNSIKESISAVEATCRVLTEENTLGKALKNLEKSGIIINKQLMSGFEKLYAYSNDKKSGIRHAIIDQPEEPDYNDAKYMLVSCSTFVNYLIGKAN